MQPKMRPAFLRGNSAASIYVIEKKPTEEKPTPKAKPEKHVRFGAETAAEIPLEPLTEREAKNYFYSVRECQS